MAKNGDPMLTVLFFGRLTDLAGPGELVLAQPAEVTDTASLRLWLGRDDPALAAALALPSTRIAVDGLIPLNDVPLLGREEVAFMPPVSGG